MSNEAEVNMALYMRLSPQEENTLKAIEGDVINLTLKKGNTKRLIWTSRTNADSRFIQLCMHDNPQPKVLFELEKGEFDKLSKEEFIARLQNSNM